MSSLLELSSTERLALIICLNDAGVTLEMAREWIADGDVLKCRLAGFQNPPMPLTVEPQPEGIPDVAEELAGGPAPYEITAELNSPTGARATFRHLRDDKAYTIRAENPALLLYVLARQQNQDIAAERDPVDRGWVPDEKVAIGIWGKNMGLRQVSNLNVLVWRLRQELETAGFDPSCLQKRKRCMRLHAESMRVL